MTWKLDIEIGERYADQVQEAWLIQAVEATRIAEKIDGFWELSLVITDDETVHELNRTYRGIDQTTDVLAFAFQDNPGDSAFPAIPDTATHLGEVLISCPQVIRQAEEQNHPPKNELMLLVIHGVLHLLGYDHTEPQEEHTMKAKESHILLQLGITR